MTVINIIPQFDNLNSSKDNYLSHKYDSEYGPNLPQFQFTLIMEETLIIPMKQYTNFTYSAYMLNHRQLCKHVGGNKDFINISSYGNKWLFYNIVKSCKINIDINIKCKI